MHVEVKVCNWFKRQLNAYLSYEQRLPYSLIISRVKIFADLADLQITTKILSLNFCPPLKFSAALQLSMKNLSKKLQNSQIHENFHPQKYYTVHDVLCMSINI